MENVLNEHFKNDELLLRAVYPPERYSKFWKNGRLSSAALKDKNGLSVNRTADLSMEKAVEIMKNSFSGYIFSIPVCLCHEVKAYLTYCPSKNNIYHSEIHGSETQLMLDDEQALRLARKAVCVG